MTTKKSFTQLLVVSFQARVGEWVDACFGHKSIENKRQNRNHRFLEEALELAQSLDCTRQEALDLVEYVYSRPTGDPAQEMGGVLTTLAALANTNELDMVLCGETELARVWLNIDKIREKQAAKPSFGTESD